MRKAPWEVCVQFQKQLYIFVLFYRKSLLSRCEALISLASESTSALSEAWLLKDCDRIPLVRSPARFERAFAEYGAALCDCLAGDALQLDSQEFARLSPVAVEVLSQVRVSK